MIPIISFSVYAHPGRTDSSGGHYDRSTGEYHYHHGYPAHQHPNGICPYESDIQTEPSIASDSPDISYSSFSSRLKKRENGSELNELTQFNENLQKDLENANTKIALLMENLDSSKSKKTFWQKVSMALSLCCFILLFFKYKGQKKITALSEELKTTNNAFESFRSSIDTLYTENTNLKEEIDNCKIKQNFSVLNELYDLQNANENLAKQLRQERTYYREKILCLEKAYEKEHEWNIKVENGLKDAKQQLEILSEQHDALLYNYKKLSKHQLFDEELLIEADVPDGVTFDECLLPHYYIDSTVEEHFHVYISENGKCYHRKRACSGATIPVHLFAVADKYHPCEKCIPRKAHHYKIPNWYYKYVELASDQLYKENKSIRYQLTCFDFEDDSIE